MHGAAPRTDANDRAWPAADTVEQTWEPTGARWFDRTDDASIGRTYTATVPPRIRDLGIPLPGALAARLEDATVALRDFDARFGDDVSPYAALLLRTEAASSSRIEHISASARQVLAAEIGESGRRNAVLVSGNVRAMLVALERSHELDADSVLAMHAALLAGDPAHAPGAWRREPVWIGTSSRSPIDAEFVAPPHELVPRLVDDLLGFARRDDEPALAQAAVAHAQFLTIHPFTDGNGRTGRALLQAMLRRRGVTRRASVPVSAGLLADTDAYFGALQATRSGDLTALFELMADAVAASITNAAQLVSDIGTVRERQTEALSSLRRDSGSWRVLDYSLRRPVFTAAMVAEALDRTPANVYRLLDPLLDAGVLASSTGSSTRRTRVYRSDAVLGVLDAFAERAGRRTTPRE